MSNGQESIAPSIKELSERGKAIYGSLVAKKEINEEMLRGKVVAIEIESENFFIGDSVLDAYNKAKEKYPDSIFHFVHIGSADKHTRVIQEAGDEYAWPI